MNGLSSYSPLQQLSLTRYGRLKMLHRDVLPKLDASDFRVKLTLKALYSTYQDLQQLGLEEEARLLTERDSAPESLEPPES
ncbi:MAG: hypothetical protein JO352_07175 [Chloroflexi bacterium]|nr:hypothetical protein [Chloroflexota bacterium]MBV9602749.1 hypothetical protein [Chloroflexota bacterium]